MYLGVETFGFIFFRILCVSWTWISLSFLKIVSFQTLFLQTHFLSLSPSFPSGTSVMQILFCLMLSHRSLKVFSFIYLFICLFVSFCILQVSSTAPSFRLVIYSYPSSSLLLNSSVIFFQYNYYIFQLSDHCLIHSYIFHDFWKFSPCSFILLYLYEFGEHLYDHYFELFIRQITYLCSIKVFF